MSKRIVMVAGALLTIALVSGCTIGDSSKKTLVDIEKIDVSKYESKVIEGSFEGVLNTKFVDIDVNGTKQMLEIADGLVEDFATLEYGSKIRLSYKYEKEALQNVVTGILEVNGKEYKGTKPIKEQVVEIDQVDEKVAYEPTNKDKLTINGKKIESYKWNMDGVVTTAPIKYKRDKNTLKTKDVTINYYLVEDTPANDIQNERWRASSVLNEIGSLKEKKQEDDSDKKFLFYVETNDLYKEVMLLKRGNKYIRFEWEAPNKEDYSDEIKAILKETH